MAAATDVDWHGVMPLAATHLIADWLSQPWFYVVVILLALAAAARRAG